MTLNRDTTASSGRCPYGTSMRQFRKVFTVQFSVFRKSLSHWSITEHRKRRILFLIDRQIMCRDAQDEHGDGGLISGPISGLAAIAIPRAGCLILRGQKAVAHSLVVILPHFAANLIQGVSCIIVAVPVVPRIISIPLHELDGFLDIVRIVVSAKLKDADSR